MYSRFGRVSLGALAALAIAGVSLAACSSDDGGDDEEDVQAVIANINEAQLSRETDGIEDWVTEQGATNIWGSTIEELKADPEIWAIESEDNFFVADSVEVDGDSAEAIGGFPGEPPSTLVAPSVVRFVKEDGLWKADDLAVADAEEPEGANTVSITMTDFAFDFDDTEFVSGAPAVFEISNDGEQRHELIMFRLPEEGDFVELLMAEEEVPGFEFLGFVGVFAAGDNAAAAYTEDLAPGRYGFVCFLPDTDATGDDQQPHAFLGMARDFTVE